MQLTEINSKLEESYKKLKEDHEKLESDFLKLREESKEDREENTRLRQLIEKLSCDLQNFKQPQNSRVESQQSKDSFNFEDIEALKQQVINRDLFSSPGTMFNANSAFLLRAFATTGLCTPGDNYKQR